jgi:hypothetical protein
MEDGMWRSPVAASTVIPEEETEAEGVEGMVCAWGANVMVDVVVDVVERMCWVGQCRKGPR